MIEYSLDEHAEEIGNLLSDAMSGEHLIVCWQAKADNSERVIYRGKISDIDFIRQAFSLRSMTDVMFEFDLGNIFFYNDEAMFIFKSEEISIQSNVVELKFPKILKVLDRTDSDSLGKTLDIDFNAKRFRNTVESIGNEDVERAEKISGHQSLVDSDNALFEQELSYLSLEEEDTVYAGVRSAPRAKPPEGKLVNLQGWEAPERNGLFHLYDLSRGGFSFLTFKEDEFLESSYIEVLGFDASNFKRPLIAQVMNIRPTDSHALEYKFGCRFLTEDEVLAKRAAKEAK